VGVGVGVGVKVGVEVGVGVKVGVPEAVAVGVGDGVAVSSDTVGVGVEIATGEGWVTGLRVESVVVGASGAWPAHAATNNVTNTTPAVQIRTMRNDFIAYLCTTPYL
jgi:hypothetical protein